MSLALTLLMSSVTCSSRTLIAVDPCPDAGSTACVGADGPPSSDARDASDAIPPLRQGLVGLWHFDDGAGSAMALDDSGNDNHAMLVDLDPATAWVTGHLGTALETGGQGYGLVSLSPSIASITSGVTVSAWVYLDGTIADYGCALSRQIGGTIDQYYHLGLGQNDATPSLFIAILINTAPIRARGPAIPRAVWTHLAGTYNGATAALYVDGVLVDSLPITGRFATDSTPLILGGNGNNQIVDEHFPGRIDEIALYNRALEPSEIQQLASGAAF